MARSRSRSRSNRKTELAEAFSKLRIVVWVLVVQMLVCICELVLSVWHILENGPVEGGLLLMQSIAVDWPLVSLFSAIELIFYSTLVYFVWLTRALWAIVASGLVIALGCGWGVIHFITTGGDIQLQSFVVFISVFPMFSGLLAGLRYHSLKKSGVVANPVEVFN